MKYSAADAVHDIVRFQIPVSIIVAVSSTANSFSSPTFSHLYSTRASRCIFIPVVWAFHWFITCVALLTMDMIILPPLFALIRFSDALLYANEN